MAKEKMEWKEPTSDQKALIKRYVEKHNYTKEAASLLVFGWAIPELGKLIYETLNQRPAETRKLGLHEAIVMLIQAAIGGRFPSENEPLKHLSEAAYEEIKHLLIRLHDDKHIELNSEKPERMIASQISEVIRVRKNLRVYRISSERGGARVIHKKTKDEREFIKSDPQMKALNALKTEFASSDETKQRIIDEAISKRLAELIEEWKKLKK